MSDQSVRGKFVWYDLMTKDPAAAARFYAAVVGWGTQHSKVPESDTDYTMWTAGSTPIGGMMELPSEAAQKGAPSHWIAYIGTPDVDATTKRAKELGGTVLHGPEDIPTVGRFTVLKDPQGASFIAFTPNGSDNGQESMPKVGEFSWHELATTDHRAAFDFYAELFGWEKTTAMDMGPEGVYQLYGRNGRDLGGMFSPSTKMPPLWFLYVMVNDADQAAGKVREQGGQVLNGPMDVPGGGRIAQCMDPQGAIFAVHSSAKTAV